MCEESEWESQRVRERVMVREREGEVRIDEEENYGRGSLKGEE